MSGKPSEAGRLTVDYIQKYASVLSKRGVAVRLFEDRPDLYDSVEDARRMVRYYCQQAGKKDRKVSLQNHNRLFFSDFAEPPLTKIYHDIPDISAKILLLSDIHVPFHDKRALDTAVNYGLKVGADHIILNGDTFDHYSESSHEKELGNRDPEYDYEQYQALLYNLRCAFPDAQITFKVGNHEKRYERWFVRSNMADMLAIKKFRYEEIMDFDKHGITKVDEYATITVAGLNIIHGHEYRGGGGINPARWLSLRTGESTLCSHFHRVSEHSEKTHRGVLQTWWSSGCLCDMQPKYMPYNNWQQGFVLIIKDGQLFHVKNKRIDNGVIM